MAAIEESKYLPILIITKLMESLQAREERLHRFKKPLEQAFLAKLKFSNNGENKNENGNRRNFTGGREHLIIVEGGRNL